MDSNDCGPACLAMILEYYKLPVSLHELREQCNPERNGVTIEDITDVASYYGFETVKVLLSATDLYNMPLPAILYWNQCHFVVLTKADSSKKNLRINDPEIGKIELAEKEFLEGWFGTEPTDEARGLVILIEPSNDNLLKQKNKKNRASQSSFKIITKNIKIITLRYYKQYLVSLLLILLTLGLNWIIPLLFQRTIDMGISGKNISLIKLFIIGQLVSSLGYFVFNTMSELLLIKINNKVSLTFLDAFLERISKLPLFFFLRKVSGDLIQRIQDLETFQLFLIKHSVMFCITTANFLLFLTLVSFYSTTILLIYISVSVVMLLWLRLFFKRREAIDYARFSAFSQYRNNYFELISGMPDIKINNAGEKTINKTKKLLRRSNDLAVKTFYVENYQLLGVRTLEILKNMTILFLCSVWVVNDVITLGMMMAINYIIGQLSGSINFFTNFIRDYQDTVISLQRLNEIEIIPEEQSFHAPLHDVNFNNRIELNDVCFKYSKRQVSNVIDHLSLSIPKGSITAIVGESGSGKTTLAKLILGFYQINSGKILIDDHDINTININRWRSFIGTVLQDGYVFNGSFIDNIAISDETPNIEMVKYSAKMANLDLFIEDFPLKYNTIIGDRGIGLSGGEKQRLLIARAVYKNPDILILDEATNSLDANNETAITENLNIFYKNKTVIIIAHRLSTVKLANQIVVLKKGRILEIGSHDTLINKKGAYYELFINQLG